MEKEVLSVRNLQVKADNNLLIDNLTFRLAEDETLAVIGPNGSGKTTLFRALLGLMPYEGTVVWKPGIRIGYVPQKTYIEKSLPLTTREFFGLRNAGKKEMDEALHNVGLEDDKPHAGHLKDHIVNERLGVLSGGELQRVLIAWALLDEPDVLLFDEPTAGVDFTAEETIYGLLHKLQEKKKMAIMLISHELQVVSRYATYVLCLNRRKICFGPPREALNQQNLEKLFGPNISLYEHH